MISHLCGTLSAVGINWLVVDVGGVGMRAWCPPGTTSSWRVGEPCQVSTSLVVREDSLTLYAFENAEARDTFDLVQSASGIGPKIALAVVSVLTPDDFRAAIAQGEVSVLTRVPGIGPKGAQKMILELKDKLAVLGAVPELSTQTPVYSSGWRAQLREGLEGLGYARKDAEKACDAVEPQALEAPTPSMSELMRAALRTLAR